MLLKLNKSSEENIVFVKDEKDEVEVNKIPRSDSQLKSIKRSGHSLGIIKLNFLIFQIMNFPINGTTTTTTAA